MSLSNFHIHHNVPCIKCKALHKEMVRVGAVVFCERCIGEEFESDDPVRLERTTYLHWLHKGE